MKKIIGLILLSVTCLSCNRYATKTEEQLDKDATAFAQYFYNWDLVKAADYVTAETQQQLKFLASQLEEEDFTRLNEKDEADTEVENMQLLNDTTAEITVNVENAYVIGAIGEPGSNLEQLKQQFTMRHEKKNGRWKADLSTLKTIPQDS